MPTATSAPPAWKANTAKNSPVTSPPGHSSVPISFSGTVQTRERHSATTPTTHPMPTKNRPSMSSTIVDHSLPSAGARLLIAPRYRPPMAYDERLAARISDLMHARPGVVERKMFGGVGWTIGGNMAVGVMRTDHLVVRLPPEEVDEAIREPHVHEFGRPGSKPMKGFVLIDPEGAERRRRARRTGSTAAPRGRRSCPSK